MEHLVIIGNGIAGITTARNVRKRSNMRITVVSAESEHFYSRTALMYIYMGHMRYEDTKPYEDEFWAKNRIELLRAYVSRIDPAAKTVHFDNGDEISYDKLVIATGSKSNKFGWPGQDLPGVQGLYSLQDLELMEESTRNIDHAVIVGGGLIGIEMAEMLLSRSIPVTFLIREQEYWDNILPMREAALISRHAVEHGLDLRKSTNLKEILAGDDGRVRAVTTESGEEIACQFVGLTPGVHPNIDCVKNSGIETGRGILVNAWLETSVPDVYAAGDCIELIAENEGERNRFEQLWYTGRMHGKALANTITGERTRYERGIWFNSAKFFDIEYQTYGFVANRPRDGENSFYWEDPGGRHLLHIVYKTGSNEVVGLNIFGIRLRHVVCERWLHEQRDLAWFVEHLAEANFDPEFYREFENDILATYNSQFPGEKLIRKRQRGLLQRMFA